MRVLFLSRFFWPHVGGVERHIEAVGRELLKQGHKITIITLKHESKLPDSQTYRGFKIVRLPYSNSKWGIWSELWQQRQVLKAADIVHCHDVFFWYLPFRFFWLKKPVFTTFHGWEGVYPIPKKNILMRKLSERLSHGSIAIGSFMKHWYRQKPDYISYGGVAPESFKDFKEVKEIIFTGRLDQDNALEKYLPALKAIKKKYHLPITFVGDGQLRRKAERVGKVTGMVKDLAPYLRRPAYIFAASYLTIWEAMSYGRPVFSLYHNPVKKDYLESFPGAKYISISGSAEELVSNFSKAREGQLPINRLIGNERLLAKRQTWKRVAQTYLNLWQKR